jgi:myo-inositol catabolism protein IolC
MNIEQILFTLVMGAYGYSWWSSRAQITRDEWREMHDRIQRTDERVNTIYVHLLNEKEKPV